MKIGFDEYCKKFKISKELLSSKIKNKKIDYTIENETIYIITKDDDTLAPQATQTQRLTVATLISLYDRENKFLKQKIEKLEQKIDKLIDDKEQLLVAQKEQIEHIYSTKDEQLKNILQLVNKKIKLQREEFSQPSIEAQIATPKDDGLVELKEHLRELDLKHSHKKIIKRRFLEIYDKDDRVILKDGKLYIDLNRYDYGDLFDI